MLVKVRKLIAMYKITFIPFQSTQGLRTLKTMVAPSELPALLVATIVTDNELSNAFGVPFMTHVLAFMEAHDGKRTPVPDFMEHDVIGAPNVFNVEGVKVAATPKVRAPLTPS